MSEIKEQVKEAPDGTLEQGEFKVKKKRGRPKKLNKKDEPVKLDLTKKEEDAVPELRTGDVDEEKSTAPIQEVEETVRELPTEETKPEIEEIVIEEITEEDQQETAQVVEQVKEEIKENPQLELPENLEKLVSFMKETGGTVEDYVRLNRDYSSLANEDLLVQYYLQTKPHLDTEEINFLLDDQFAWDEDVDEERDIRKKKLAMKEEIAKAKGFLEDTKSKYYDEIKLRPGVTQEQQKATDFFNRYNKEQEAQQEQHNQFKTNTNKFFTDEFKGFDFNLGEKKFRYKVNNTNDVANAQSDLNNFIGKFLDKSGKINDLQGYHKALYAARNSDTIAQHFYEQGKTDAIRNMTAKSKNISTDTRPSHNGEVFINGMKVRAISGVDSSKLKIKTKNKN